MSGIPPGESILMSGVGTQKVFEDDRVIVWHLDLEPGQHGEQHTHTLDYVVRVISESTLEVLEPTHELLYDVQLEAGPAVSFQLDGDQIISDRPGISCCPGDSQRPEWWFGNVSGSAHRIQELAVDVALPAAGPVVNWCELSLISEVRE